MYRPLDQAAVRGTLFRHLGFHGHTGAGELQRLLGVSSATFSRLMAAHAEDVLAVGRGRATRYAARRRIEGLPSALPLYEVLDGRTVLLGTLHPVRPDGYYVESDSPVRGFYPGLPWFLDDLRPSGFLGRLVPSQHPELGFPRSVDAWSVDQVVVYLAGHGADLVGNLVLGEGALQRALQATPAHPVARGERSERYGALAADAMAAGIPGSSAAGEQPKFLATRIDGDRHVPVLVKFSPPVRDEASRRVADLLVCEHLALARIADAGLPAARTALVRSADRTFLEVERFDREGRQARRGLVSLRALDAEFVGDPTSWTSVARALHVQRRIPAEALRRVVWLERFGDWIGNTDKHLGNLSFHFQSGALGALAPVYDMLPMGYAPRSGEVVPVELRLPTLSPSQADLWVETWRVAVAFWRDVSAHPEVSAGFAAIAARNADRVEEMGPTLARLPRAG